MRKRKYLIGLAAGAVLSIAVAGTANAALVYNSQSLVVTPSSGPQDKKTPGPLNSFFTDVITNYTDTGLGGGADKYAVRTRLYFPKDFVFTTTGLATCEPTPAFVNGSTANAVALCPQAIVSTPDHTNTNKATLKVPGLADVPATVTAFNGTPEGGFPRILLHSQTPAANRTLIGTLKPSDLPGFGRMLDVPVDLGPFQQVAAISDFRVTIGKVKLPKGKAASAAKKKKKAPQKYYIMAKCSKKTWNFQAITDYNTGAAPGTPVSTSTATTSSKCKQKKAKKKK